MSNDVLDPKLLKLIDQYDESSDDDEAPKIVKKDPKKKYFDGPTGKLDHFSPDEKYGTNTPLYDKYLKDLYKNSAGVYHTVSIALPGSLLEQFPNEKEMNDIIGQISRWCSIFQLDEVIIYSETAKVHKEKDPMEQSQDFNVYFANVLQYIETPPYIRTLIFPKHPDFKYVKGLPAFEAPHHVREEDVGKYREAIVVEKTKVLAGLTKPCFIDKELEPGTRVTLQLFPSGKNGKSVEATVVDPGYPREKDGVYWGYKTRLAERFSDIWTNCPYSDKYDFTAYVTDEEGTNIDSNDFSIPSFRHLLLVFGGEAIKNAMEADDRIVEKESVSKLFNAHFNGCPNRFSKNVFLTELIPTSLSVLRKKFVENVAPTKPSISKKRRIIPKIKKNQ